MKAHQPPQLLELSPPRLRLPGKHAAHSNHILAAIPKHPPELSLAAKKPITLRGDQAGTLLEDSGRGSYADAEFWTLGLLRALGLGAHSTYGQLDVWPRA